MALSAHEKRIVELIIQAKGDADLKRIAAELRSTRQAAEGAQKSLGGISGALGTATKWAGGFVSGLGVQQIIAWGRAILDAADALDAAAEQAGIGVERYQTLKEAFRSLEVDGRKFETGVERLATALSDTLAGDTNTATEALERLGVKAKILSGEIQTTDELIDALANSQKALSGDVTFTSDVVDILGKKLGVDYANALRDGKLALAEMTAAQAEFGVVSEEEIAKLAEASEVVEQFQTRAGNAILIWSAGAIEAFQDVANAVSETVRRFLDGEALLTAAHNQRMAALERSARAGRQAGIDANLNMLGVGRSALDDFLRDVRPAPAVTPRAPRRAGGGGGGRSGPSEAEREAAERAKAEAKKVEDAIKAKLDAERDALELEQRQTEAWREQARALNELVDPLAAYTRQVEELGKVQATGALTDAARRKELERLANEMFAATHAAEGWDEANESAARTLEQQREDAMRAREQWEFVGQAVGQATYDVITGTAKMSVAVKQMVASILAEIGRLLAIKIAAKVVTALFGAQPAAKGGAYVGGVQAFAKGGILTGPQVFGMAGGIGIAGEAGPEMVAPLRRDSAGNLGVGAVAPKVTVNNYAGAEVAVSQTNEGVQIDILRRAIADDIRRGGTPIARSLESAYRLGRQAAAFS